MNIHNRYILYTPQAEATAPADSAGALRQGERQREMQDWLALYDGSKANFTPVSERGRQGAGAAAGPAVAGEVEPQQWVPFVENRRGKVLDAGTVLKVDQYPGLHSKALTGGANPQPRINGAPNYRALPTVQGAVDASIHGVAQPTIDGIRGVLDQVGAGPGGGGKTAVWTNLREEPVVYVNGRSLNLRHLAEINSNSADPGASSREVERTEAQLKSDVLHEAARNHGRLLVHDEGPDGSVVARWETVTPESVQTPREVYDMLRQEGYKVDYARIPVTDEKSPEPQDFDALVQRVKDADPEAQLIFNCHAGRGRTTTGTVVAGLVRRAQEGVQAKTSVKRSRPVREDIREQGNYKTGEYKVILSLVSALERGPQSKAEADEIIDRCASLQNLREAIESYKTKAETAATPAERQAAMQRGKDYLERYYNIVAFDAYAKEQAPSGFKQPFSRWLEDHPEVRRTRGNLELALGLPGGEASSFA